MHIKYIYIDMYKNIHVFIYIPIQAKPRRSCGSWPSSRAISWCVESHPPGESRRRMLQSSAGGLNAAPISRGGYSCRGCCLHRFSENVSVYDYVCVSMYIYTHIYLHMCIHRCMCMHFSRYMYILSIQVSYCIHTGT